MKNYSPPPRPPLTRANRDYIKKCTEKGALPKSKAPKEEEMENQDSDSDADTREVDSSIIMP
jgi:hypothetical protein